MITGSIRKGCLLSHLIKLHVHRNSMQLQAFLVVVITGDIPLLCIYPGFCDISVKSKGVLSCNLDS